MNLIEKLIKLIKLKLLFNYYKIIIKLAGGKRENN